MNKTKRDTNKSSKRKRVATVKKMSPSRPLPPSLLVTPQDQLHNYNCLLAWFEGKVKNPEFQCGVEEMQNGQKSAAVEHPWPIWALSRLITVDSSSSFWNEMKLRVAIDDENTINQMVLNSSSTRMARWFRLTLSGFLWIPSSDWNFFKLWS